MFELNRYSNVKQKKRFRSHDPGTSRVLQYSITSSRAGRGEVHHTDSNCVRPELSIALKLEDRGQLRAGTTDAALDGADGAIADVGGFFVGKTRGAHQDQGFALIFRQFVDRLLEVFHCQLAHLFG